MSAGTGQVAIALSLSSAADRDDAAAFAGRVARWEATGPVRVRADPDPAADIVRFWGTTPFDTLVTRAVHGRCAPGDVTVRAGNLVAALAVSTSHVVDPGPPDDAAWRSQLPPPAGFVVVDTVPARVLADLADTGVAAARASPGPAGGASTALLDSTVLTARGAGMSVTVPLRVLFALSGMGFAPAGADQGGAGRGGAGQAGDDEVVRISATDAWVRLDGRFGAVVRRRQALLPLLF